MKMRARQRKSQSLAGPYLMILFGAVLFFKPILKPTERAWTEVYAENLKAKYEQWKTPIETAHRSPASEIEVPKQVPPTLGLSKPASQILEAQKLKLQTELQLISLTYADDLPRAETHKREAVENHQAWVKKHFGSEVYARFKTSTPL